MAQITITEILGSDDVRTSRAILIANDKKLIPFEQFCQLIAGKKIKITALRINKDQKNCIQNLNIQYKVKKYMVWMKE
jgi:hypothetical protein